MSNVTIDPQTDLADISSSVVTTETSACFIRSRDTPPAGVPTAHGALRQRRSQELDLGGIRFNQSLQFQNMC